MIHSLRIRDTRCAWGKVESGGYGLVVFFPDLAPGEHGRTARHWITAPGEKVRHFNECMRRGDEGSEQAYSTEGNYRFLAFFSF